MKNKWKEKASKNRDSSVATHLLIRINKPLHNINLLH